ncbi:MAG: trehalose-phosphatase [Candidatus Melainabacteria bacterium]|nr:MAG: trehalose-phosphatase [Candidatus Melainabacteria bacterium]
MTNISRLLEQCRSCKSLFLGLDRDGTLVPYDAIPEEAIMNSHTRELLIKLARLPNLHVAIVSARGSLRLKQDVDTQEIILAGNYGLEMRHLPGDKEWVAPEALKAIPELRRLHAELQLIAKQFKGAILEDDYYSFCLHWHLVPENQREKLSQALQELKPELDTVYMRNLPTSYEFMPKMLWNKGLALEKIASLQQLSCEAPYCVYMGDTDQDEPAFEWANNHGGSSVRVGTLNGKTKATYRLNQPADVIWFLEQLLEQRSLLAATAFNPEEDPAEREKRIERVFSSMKADYAKGLTERIKDLKTIVEKAKHQPNDLESLTEARTRMHRLKGTIGSYGFPEISFQLGVIEVALENIEKASSLNKNLSEAWLEALPIIEASFDKALSAAASPSEIAQ